MYKVLTGQQMKEIDLKVINDLQIPSLILMENAGRSVYEQIIYIINENNIDFPSVLVVCGKGNNGGDGFVTARHLIENEIQTTVVSLFNEEDLSGDALINHNILKHFSEILYRNELEDNEFTRLITESDMVVDAILGTGLKSEISELPLKTVKLINEYSEGLILSIDIPSGINADNAKVMGCAILADYTVTFFAPKVGNVLYPGVDYCGEIAVSNISIPEYLINNSQIKHESYNLNLITKDYVSKLFPIRPDNSHKGYFGHVLTIAGSFGLTGAAYLSAYSALKTGVGYSTLATPKSLIPIFASMAPELIYLNLEDKNEGILTENNVSTVSDKLDKFNSILLGPGIGTDFKTVNFVKEFIETLTYRGVSCVIDADGLNCLSLSEEFSLPENSIITPHPKELSRLLKRPVEQILDNRINSAIEAAQKFNAIVILKGAKTIIAEPDGTIYINPTGNSALATAGTGDVLAGMIAGFIAQNLSAVDAAILGVYLHGLAGDLAAKSISEFSTTASDVIENIPSAIKSFID